MAPSTTTALRTELFLEQTLTVAGIGGSLQSQPCNLLTLWSVTVAWSKGTSPSDQVTGFSSDLIGA